MTHILARASFAVILLAAACTPLPPKPAPKPPVTPTTPESAIYNETAFDAVPGWAQASLVPSLRAFLTGCGRPQVPLLVVCELAAGVPRDDEAAARQFFESQFTAYAVVSNVSGEAGLITGYFEPVIEGARTRDADNRYPIYGVPDDLIVVDLTSVNPDLRNMRLRGRVEGRRLVPYYSRAEIDSRAALPASIIAWAKDPVELFFLQIQGSGQIQLADGARLRVGYADQNGHPFRSLGRYLVDRGELPLEQASMQNIKAWAAANPHKLQDALNANPSYVFFREVYGQEGPFGALNVPLTAGYSLAVDRRFIPLGAPVYLATTYPLSEERLERLMTAQDVGGAIRGAVRADLFWGSGADAGAQAGRMRNPGRMWLLWPKGRPLPREGVTCC
jgi:membrane-bound lytic murein transglycosylase A